MHNTSTPTRTWRYHVLSDSRLSSFHHSQDATLPRPASASKLLFPPFPSPLPLKLLFLCILVFECCSPSHFRISLVVFLGGGGRCLGRRLSCYRRNNCTPYLTECGEEERTRKNRERPVQSWAHCRCSASVGSHRALTLKADRAWS